jgi:glucose/galactose transporter
MITSPSTLEHPVTPTGKPNHTYEITIIGVLFFIFGFVTWINGSLIAYLKIACQLTNLQAFFVAFAFFISYFVMGIPSAFVLKVTGYKKGMVLGLAIMALGAILFVPAAKSLVYGFFLTALFIIGTGLAILQAAVNPYVTILGPIESAAQRISIMGICNKVAGGIGTYVLGALLLVNTDKFTESLKNLDPEAKSLQLHELASRAVVPYIIISLVLVVLALLVWFSKLPEIDTDHEDADLALTNSNKTSVFQFPNLVLGVISLFLYVGVEVVAGDSIIVFGQSQHILLETARFFTIYTLIAMILGYILGIFLIPRYLKQDNALKISAILGLILTAGIVLSHGKLAIIFLASLGFANAIMWPAMWPLALEGLGKFTKIGSALLIMAIAGGAIIPLILAKLFDLLPGQTQFAYLIAIPCYAYILYYASMGHSIKSWSK